MFTQSNFKKHLDVIQSLKKALSTELSEIEDILDLLLKWMSCRMIDNNPGVTKGIIEILSDLMDSLEKESYTLYDSEAAILLPMLVERAGNSA